VRASQLLLGRVARDRLSAQAEQTVLPLRMIPGRVQAREWGLRRLAERMEALSSS
jgi:hypothetical protein